MDTTSPARKLPAGASPMWTKRFDQPRPLFRADFTYDEHGRIWSRLYANQTVRFGQQALAVVSPWAIHDPFAWFKPGDEAKLSLEAGFRPARSPGGARLKRWPSGSIVEVFRSSFISHSYGKIHISTFIPEPAPGTWEPPPKKPRGRPRKEPQ